MTRARSDINWHRISCWKGFIRNLAFKDAIECKTQAPAYWEEKGEWEYVDLLMFWEYPGVQHIIDGILEESPPVTRAINLLKGHRVMTFGSEYIEFYNEREYGNEELALMDIIRELGGECE